MLYGFSPAVPQPGMKPKRRSFAGFGRGKLTGNDMIERLAIFLLAMMAVSVTGAPQGYGSPSADLCQTRGNVLGVSRVVEIDTTSGPIFGGGASQPSAVDFLADREVVLTFDDGPLRHYTQRVLKALADECTKATFFMVGRMAVSDPDMVREVATQGHTVALHTWSHKNLGATGSQRMIEDVELGFSAVSKALGRAPAPFFRFPYLASNRSSQDYVRSRGLGAFWVDIDSKDYQTRDAAAVQRRIIRDLEHKGKGIVLMHDIQRSTAHGIASLLQELRQKGFKIVHIVAKGHAETIASYDDQAGRLLAAKQIAAAGNPLANRAATWPANGMVDDSVQRPARRATRKVAAPSNSGGDFFGEILPWSESEPVRRAPPRPAPRIKPPEDRWQIRVFGH